MTTGYRAVWKKCYFKYRLCSLIQKSLNDPDQLRLTLFIVTVKFEIAIYAEKDVMRTNGISLVIMWAVAVAHLDFNPNTQASLPKIIFESGS